MRQAVNMLALLSLIFFLRGCTWLSSLSPDPDLFHRMLLLL